MGTSADLFGKITDSVYRDCFWVLMAKKCQSPLVLGVSKLHFLSGNRQVLGNYLVNDFFDFYNLAWSQFVLVTKIEAEAGGSDIGAGLGNMITQNLA